MILQQQGKKNTYKYKYWSAADTAAAGFGGGANTFKNRGQPSSPPPPSHALPSKLTTPPTAKAGAEFMDTIMVWSNNDFSTAPKLLVADEGAVLPPPYLCAFSYGVPTNNAHDTAHKCLSAHPKCMDYVPDSNWGYCAVDEAAPTTAKVGANTGTDTGTDHGNKNMRLLTADRRGSFGAQKARARERERERRAESISANN